MLREEDISATAVDHQQEHREDSLVLQWERKSLFLSSILDQLSLDEEPGCDVPGPFTSETLSNSKNEQDGNQQETITDDNEEIVFEAENSQSHRDDTRSHQPIQQNLHSLVTEEEDPDSDEFLRQFGPSSDDHDEEDNDVPTPLPPSSATLREDTTEQQEEPPTNQTVCPLWTSLTEDGLHRCIRYAVAETATHAARHPWAYVMSIILFSFSIAAIGIMTNVTIYYDHESIFTPMNSPPAKHGKWVNEESGFKETADMLLIVHADGDSILNRDAVNKAFEALDTLRSVPGYDQVCAESTWRDSSYPYEPNCWIWSVTQFWGHNWTLFEELEPTNLELLHAFSQPFFPDGIPIVDEAIFGAIERSNQTAFLAETVQHITQATNEWYGGYYGPNTTSDVDYLSHVPAYMITIGFPDTTSTEEFQGRALPVLKRLRDQWKAEEESSLKLEFFCSYAYLLEYERALNRDMPLVLVIFFVMLTFTMLVFHNYGRHKQQSTGLWQSRASLGLASVVTIGMSLMSGFGMMFCWGVPFTNITLMLPFIILGVGLDDTFIITGAYFRRLRQDHMEERAKMYSPEKDEIEEDKSAACKESGNNQLVGKPINTRQATQQQQEEAVVVRIRDTLKEVGLSISLTTTTTTFAFVLGCISTIPGIRWLCIYASVTIVVDFIYQISFFVALLVLDERRVAGTLLTKENAKYPGCLRWWMNYCCCCWKSCCCCCGCHGEPRESSAEIPEMGVDWIQEEEEFFMDRMMRWYAKQLMRPAVKLIVVVAFMVFLGLNIYSTTKLEQHFDIEDYVPKDSYTRPFFRALEDYSTLVTPMYVYFRNVDQSDPEVQRQMLDFVDDVAALPQVGQPPEFCWVRDIYSFLSARGNAMEEIAGSDMFQAFDETHKQRFAFIVDTLNKGNFTFEEKLEVAMNIPLVRSIYGEDIVRDEEGRIITSRCLVYIRNLDLQDIHEQIDTLHATREVTMTQPINQHDDNRDELPFFAYDSLFSYWQLYTVAVSELIFTTIWGVVAVCAVGFIIIPHWSAVLFVGPLIVMLYFNLLGALQVCGIYINAVTYVTVVISIGFLCHFLLRYYEAKGATREAKVKETLETMGASILLGGFTTWLGVIPMAFSTTKIFKTLFVAFFAMVSWGLLVGLVFLPVLLSLCGPVGTTQKTGAAEEAGTPKHRNSKEHTPAFRHSVTECETTHRDFSSSRDYSITLNTMSSLEYSMPPLSPNSTEH